MKRDVHDEHRLMARYRRSATTTKATTSSPSAGRVYSSSSTADPDDREAIGRFPTFCLDGTIPGTDPETELLRKAENEGWRDQ